MRSPLRSDAQTIATGRSDDQRTSRAEPIAQHGYLTSQARAAIALSYAKDLLAELFMGNRTTRVAHEVAEEPHLERLQRDFATVDVHALSEKVHLEVTPRKAAGGVDRMKRLRHGS
jgi:hypothetical protein